MTGASLARESIRFAAPLAFASGINGGEARQTEAYFEGNNLYVSSRPFAPSTYFVKVRQGNTSFEPPVSHPIALPYNDYAFTVDAFNRQGNIDGKGNSYAAELVPSPIVSEGVEFDVLNDVTRKNVVRCNGQRIALPEGNYDRLYLLVASLTEDQEAEFAIDGRAFRCMVPYYTGFFGQWGHDGETGYVKDGVLAYVGTHRHSATRGNDPYVFTYMYKVSLPVNGPVHDLQLPDNKDIVVFVATAVDDSNDDLVPLCEVRALPSMD